MNLFLFFRSQYPRLAEIPFDSDRKLMSTLNQTPQGKILFTKGAADVLTERMLITTEEKEKRINAVSVGSPISVSP